MASLPAGTPLPKFDNTLGALLLGGLFAMSCVPIVSLLASFTHLNDGCDSLWGLTCVQTFTYFTQKSKDGPVFKAIVRLARLYPGSG